MSKNEHFRFSWVELSVGLVPYRFIYPGYYRCLYHLLLVQLNTRSNESYNYNIVL